FRHPKHTRETTGRSTMFAREPELQPCQRFATSVRHATLALTEEMNGHYGLCEYFADCHLSLGHGVGQTAVGGKHDVAATPKVIGNTLPGIAQLVSWRCQIYYLAI